MIWASTKISWLLMCSFIHVKPGKTRTQLHGNPQITNTDMHIKIHQLPMTSKMKKYSRQEWKPIRYCRWNARELENTWIKHIQNKTQKQKDWKIEKRISSMRQQQVIYMWNEILKATKERNKMYHRKKNLKYIPQIWWK